MGVSKRYAKGWPDAPHYNMPIVKRRKPTVGRGCDPVSPPAVLAPLPAVRFVKPLDEWAIAQAFIAQWPPGPVCPYCRRVMTDPTLDHVMPKVRARGLTGRGHARTTVVACSGCNNRKGKMTLTAFLELLARENASAADGVTLGRQH